MLIGTQDQTFFPKPIEEKFYYVKAMGFDSFEIDGQVLLQELDEIKEAIQATGLKILTACNGYEGWIGDIEASQRQAAVKEISEILKALQAIDGKGIVVPAGWGIRNRQEALGKLRTPEEDWEVLAASLQELNRVADETKTYIYLEPLNRYEDHMINQVADAARYIRELKLGRVKIIPDFFHMNIEEDDISKALRDYQDLIGHLHIADNQRFEPGSGTMDFAKYFETLKETGYQGQIVYECSVKAEDPAAAYQASLKFLKATLAN